MHFLYIDEESNTNNQYLVLTGLILDSEKWHSINQKCIDLKRAYFFTDKYNLKNIRRNKYDDSKQYQNLSDDQKNQLRIDLNSILADEDITYLSALIDRTKMKNKDSSTHYYLAYSFILQRYEYFLRENNSKGIVVYDKASTTKEVVQLRQIHQDHKETGVPTGVKGDPWIIETSNGEKFELHSMKTMEVKSIVENLLFISDDESNFLQLADFACSAVSLKFNRNNTTYFDNIEKRFKRSKSK
jgi:hypothetical protein